jgi:hypothetical protein
MPQSRRLVCPACGAPCDSRHVCGVDRLEREIQAYLASPKGRYAAFQAARRRLSGG